VRIGAVYLFPMRPPVRRLIRTLFYVFASVLVALYIVRTGSVDSFLASVGGLTHVGSFIAGMFFTSVFTTAPSMVVLGELALTTPLWVVALFGGVGAVFGDYILFLVVRDGLSKDFDYLAKHSSGVRRAWAALRRARVRWLLPALGAFVLASPLPDELGLAMMGLSTIKPERFLLISFVMNTLGIFAIGLIARSLAG